MEPRLDKINTAYEPLLTRFTLFKSDIASSLKFSQQFSDGDLIDFS